MSVEAMVFVEVMVHVGPVGMAVSGTVTGHTSSPARRVDGKYDRHCGEPHQYQLPGTSDLIHTSLSLSAGTLPP